MTVVALLAFCDHHRMMPGEVDFDSIMTNALEFQEIERHKRILPRVLELLAEETVDSADFLTVGLAAENPGECWEMPYLPVRTQRWSGTVSPPGMY